MGRNSGDVGRGKWKALSDSEREDHIRKSLRQAGVPEKVIDDNMKDFVKDSRPGDNRTKERGTENRGGRPNTRRVIMTGRVVALLIALAGLAEASSKACDPGLREAYEDLESAVTSPEPDENMVTIAHLAFMEKLNERGVPISDAVTLVTLNELLTKLQGK